MEILLNEKFKEAEFFIKKAIQIAEKSSCLRSKCGALIVKDNEIIGEGFNSPPNNDEKQRRCSISKETYDNKITDKTCCIHAEQRAMIQALIKNPLKIKNSKLYFVRIDKENCLEKSGNPYCTICSKMALDIGIKYFILWHKQGIVEYNTDEYNTLSYDYKANLTNL